MAKKTVDNCGGYPSPKLVEKATKKKSKAKKGKTNGKK